QLPREAFLEPPSPAPFAVHPVGHTERSCHPSPSPRCGLWHRNTVQVAVHEWDSDRAFPHGGGDSLDCSPADVTRGEHPGQARLKKHRMPVGVPPGIRVVEHVLAGEDETRPVPREVLAEPFGPWLGADEDEQAVGWDTSPHPGLYVLNHQRLEMIGAGAVDHLHAGPDLDLRRRVDLAPGVVAHAY